MKSNCYSLIYSYLVLALYFCPLVLGHPVFDNLEFIIIATWSCKMNDVKWIGSSTLSLNPQMGKWELDMQNIFVGKNGCIINMNTMFLHHRRVFFLEPFVFMYADPSVAQRPFLIAAKMLLCVSCILWFPVQPAWPSQNNFSGD